jgi:hypothetical protein
MSMDIGLTREQVIEVTGHHFKTLSQERRGRRPSPGISPVKENPNQKTKTT